MQRILVFAALLLPATFAQAQTTIKITLPDTTTCTYPTGPVSSNTTPGQLQATATAIGSGAGCQPPGVGGVSFGPASPLAPGSQQLGNAGGAAALSFQPVNAATCTASVTGPSGGVITGGATICSSAATCSAAQNVSATFAANATGADLTNTVTVSCAGTTGAPISSSATVIVSHGGGSCPILTSSTSGIANFNRYQGSHNVGQPGGNARSVDVTSFNSIWGAWPGTSGLVSYFTLPSTNYISASFQSTNFFATATPQSVGYYQVGETDRSVAVSMTISTSCGDFSNPAVFPTTSTVVPGCWGNKLIGDGYIAWTNGHACTLVDGQPYFLNIINADISNLAPNGGGSAASTFNSSNSFCSGAGCVDPIIARWIP